MPLCLEVSPHTGRSMCFCVTGDLLDSQGWHIMAK